MKLSDFRLQTYNEREALNYALLKLDGDCPEWHRAALDALLTRLSRTQCQPGGCELCSDGVEGDDD